MKVLVIEDEKMVAESIRAILESKGFEVETVYDGEAGTEYAELGIYDLLILDVMMTKLNGFQVARQVRADRCSTPILMLTARSDIEDRIQGLNAGADYYLTKPFDSNPLPLFSALGAAMVAGLAYTLLSYTKRFTSAPVIIFHFSLFSTVCAGLLMIPGFVVPSLKVMGMLLMVGLFAAGGQYLLTYAYQQAPASEVSIYQYSGVVFTALLSYLIFGETLTLTSIVGAIVILAAIFWVFEYSKHKAKEA